MFTPFPSMTSSPVRASPDLQTGQYPAWDNQYDDTRTYDNDDDENQEDNSNSNDNDNDPPQIEMIVSPVVTTTTTMLIMPKPTPERGLTAWLGALTAPTRRVENVFTRLKNTLFKDCR